MPEKQPDCKTITVTVLGAGVTGLSVAHELADRGFRVQVIEKAQQSPHRNPTGRPDTMGPEPDIGGIARTQWAVDPDGRLSSDKFCWQEPGTTPDPFYGAGRAIRLLDPQSKAMTMYLGLDPFADGPSFDELANMLLLRVPPSQPGGVFSLDLPEDQTDLRKKLTAVFEKQGYVDVREPSGASSTERWAAVQLMGVAPADDKQLVPVALVSPKKLGAVLSGPSSGDADGSPEASKKAHRGKQANLDDLLEAGAEGLVSLVNVVKRDPAAQVYFDPKTAIPLDPESDILLKELATTNVLGVMLEVSAYALSDTSHTFELNGKSLRLIPGEHGWRFFPGFYRHLFNTMARTPLTDERHGNAFTERTMLDNLEAVDWQVVADPTRRRPAAFRRTVVRNPIMLRKQYYAMRRQLGYRPSDVMRFGLRSLRYMTSSSERRRRYYEDLSYYDFLTVRDLAAARDTEAIKTLDASADPNDHVKRLHYGQRFDRAIKHSPRALVAMKAETTDTRTQGNISVQLAMSQLGLHPRDDSTLPGPTSRAWFDHWRRYLEDQGVRFFQGEVETVVFEADTPVSIKVKWPDNKPPKDFVAPGPIDEADATGESGCHYVVSALDLVALTEVLPSALEDFTRIRNMLATPTGVLLVTDENRAKHARRVTARNDDENLQVLTGIQFYFRQRLNFAEGHMYFPDSPWGLSAVSQPQFWQSDLKKRMETRAYGALSVDLGKWVEIASPDNPEHGPDARTEAQLIAADTDPGDATADTIAQEVWRQIIRGYGEGARLPGAVPPPAAYHLDRYLRLGADGKPTHFDAPFLVNNIGAWKLRPHGEPVAPGAPGGPARVPGDGAYQAMLGDDGQPHIFLNAGGNPSGTLELWKHRLGGYRVYHDGFVIAGPHMRTFTRMNTMEACNESARHAVNAILDHLSRGKLPSGAAAPSPEAYGPDFMPTPYGDYCRIWDPETHEIPELELMRRIDEKLLPPEHNQWDMDDRPADAPDPVRAPHVFDLLGIDTLPDLVETDDDAEAVFRMLEGVIDEIQRAQPEEARAAFAIWPGGPETDFASNAAMQGANIFITRLMKLTRELLERLSRGGGA